jgi:hypothetical protein
MCPFPQFVHNPQALLRCQPGISQRVGLIGFLEAVEYPDDFLHTSLYLLL